MQLQKPQISFLCVVTQMTHEHLSLAFLTDCPALLMTTGTVSMKCYSEFHPKYDVSGSLVPWHMKQLWRLL